MYSRWIRWQCSEQRRNATSGSRRDGSRLLRIERLESRELLAVSMPNLAGTEGTPINGQVATFSSTDVQGTNPQATIAWGDGHTTAGVIVANGTNFSVDGANTYAVPGTFPITVTITGTLGSTSETGKATIASIAPMGTTTTITAVAGVPFTGVVASFTDSYPSLTEASYNSTISWGDGHSSLGTVEANGNGGFSVVGTNVYQTASTTLLPVVVTIVRNVDGNTITVNSSASVVSGSNVLSGQLDPLSDTGVSNSDGITAINQPTFTGTALPYAIVQLYGRRSDQAQPVLLGQAVTSVTGIWQMSVGALADGVYSFTAAQIPTTGLPTTMTSLTPSSVIIDTAPPTVVSASVTRGSDQINVTLKDALSGLNLTSLANPLNYALVGRHHGRIHPSSVTIVSNASVRTNDPITVALQFSGLGEFRGAQKIALGGITDLAGNPLPKEYIKAIKVISGTPVAPQAVRVSARHPHRGQRHV